MEMNAAITRTGNIFRPFSGGEKGVISAQSEVSARAFQVPGEGKHWAGHLPLLPLLHGFGRLPFLTSLIGIDQERKPLQLNFSSAESWHMLVEGPGGTGKSSLLRACAASLALSNRQSKLQFIGIDPGGRDLVFLESMPHMLTDLAVDPGFTAEILKWLVDEMEHRRLWQIANPHLVVWLDDIDVIAGSLPGQSLQHVTKLWVEGPQSGIHLAVSSSTQVSNLRTIFPSLASSVHISLTGRINHKEQRTVHPEYRGILRVGRKRTIFKPVSFLARDMNTAAGLFGSGFRMPGSSLYEARRADVSG